VSTLAAAVPFYGSHVAAREGLNERIRRLIRDSKLNDTDVGSALGVSATQARRYLDGTTASLKLEQAIEISKKLNISLENLIGDSRLRSSFADSPSGLPDRISALTTLDGGDDHRFAPPAEVVALSNRVDQIEERMTRIAARLEDQVALLSARLTTPKRPREE